MTAADAADYRIGTRALDEVARAEYDALFDPGTGLPKRALLYDRLLLSLARTKRAGTAVGVFFLRPEGLISNAALMAVAKVVAGELRLDDTVARTGPAELVIVCHVRDAQESRVVIRRIAHALRVVREAGPMTVGFASGAGGDDPGEVLVRAASATPVPLTETLNPIPDALPEKLRSAL